MEFKSSGTTFSNKDRFTSDMKRFVSEEAARFTRDSNEAAFASMDEIVEKAARFSMEKHKGKAREQKKILKQLDRFEKEYGKTDQSIHPSNQEHFSGSSRSYFSDEFDVDSDSIVESKEFTSNIPREAESERNESSRTQEHKEKQQSEKKENAKKEHKKESKKASQRLVVANMLRAKKDMENDIAGEQITGDAMKDGNTGLVRTFTELINPMHYVKKLMAYIAAIIAPYIAAFFSIMAVLMVIIMLIFSILSPIAAVGEALDNFLSLFSEDSTYVNSSLSQSEIDDIVADSGADETQETVIQFALSKVGYPYSQERRTSGSAYDCSSLAYYSWKEADVDISYGSGYPPTAAEGARVLNSDGKCLSMMDLKPGDLIYYGGSSNGRYMGIYHVAVYIGDGKVVEALNERCGVVYQNLRTNNAILVARPNR